MYPIRSPQTKSGLKYQQKQQKAHIHMEAEQCSTKWSLFIYKEKIKKEIKDFLSLMKMKPQHTQTYGTQWKLC